MERRIVKNAMIPDDLKWILHPTFYSDFMRSQVISWLLEDRVEVASLGIIDSQFECEEAVSGVNVFPDSAGPYDRSRSSKRYLKEDTDVFKISHDDICDLSRENVLNSSRSNTERNGKRTGDERLRKPFETGNVNG